jgi:cellulose synthase/poly-beta-1,6-N-acetylglucosamine synthase-like glycosyltransferase
MIFSKDIVAAPNASFAAALSIIVPVTYGEIRWRGLFQDLETLPLTTEIIVVGPQCPERAQQWLEQQREAGRPTMFVKSAKGRAKQLNNAVRVSNRPFLWFLHADTRLPDDTLRHLATAAQVDAGGLWFFDLEFFGRWTATDEAQCVGSCLAL